ncbi:MAG TPA: glycosyltransferase family 4 protein [Gemmatimonadaceae bacterium]|nr:glycosyltransferase family 4 protein [Gemmatimonadaceae bacterium]
MRIAMISTPFLAVPPRDYGGTERVVYELIEGLTDHGHDVTVFATGDSTTSAELQALYDEAQWPPGIMTDLNHVSWAMQQVAQGDFDLVHAHSAVALGLKRLVPDLPMVYTLHHERDEQLSEFYRHHLDAHYIAISADQKQREISLPNCAVIHHGIDPKQFRCVIAPADYVAFIGRFAEIKGPHIAIDVAGEAGVPLRIAGDVHDVDREFGDREVLPRLSQPHVTYLGSIGMEAKVPLLCEARALLMPIDWNEPFGLVMIEAMLSGCPVVAFPRGSVPELVDEGVTGFVVNDAVQMRDVIRPGGALDHFDRGRCRARAAERFSRMRMVDDHVRYYERVLGRDAEQRRSRLVVA